MRQLSISIVLNRAGSQEATMISRGWDPSPPPPFHHAFPALAAVSPFLDTRRQVASERLLVLRDDALLGLLEDALFVLLALALLLELEQRGALLGLEHGHAQLALLDDGLAVRLARPDALLLGLALDALVGLELLHHDVDEALLLLGLLGEADGAQAALLVVGLHHLALAALALLLALALIRRALRLELLLPEHIAEHALLVVVLLGLLRLLHDAPEGLHLLPLLLRRHLVLQALALRHHVEVLLDLRLVGLLLPALLLHLLDALQLVGAREVAALLAPLLPEVELRLVLLGDLAHDGVHHLLVALGLLLGLEVERRARHDLLLEHALLLAAPELARLHLLELAADGLLPVQLHLVLDGLLAPALDDLQPFLLLHLRGALPVQVPHLELGLELLELFRLLADALDLHLLPDLLRLAALHLRRELLVLLLKQRAPRALALQLLHLRLHRHLLLRLALRVHPPQVADAHLRLRRVRQEAALLCVVEQLLHVGLLLPPLQHLLLHDGAREPRRRAVAATHRAPGARARGAAVAAANA
mmetsp:Transcript_46411/g.145215  ORF Transcript_46411/g.145215 Transcript_46411/m.145215 type:complete len:534 (-) Transcript_46411:73-1674(-)